MATMSEGRSVLPAGRECGMRVLTRSGSVYELRPGRVRRANAGHGLRRDGEWLELRGMVPLRIGEPMVLYLEPLGEGDVTERTTTPVAGIVFVDAEGRVR